MLTEHPAPHGPAFTALDIAQYQRSPGRPTNRCFQGKTFGIALRRSKRPAWGKKYCQMVFFSLS
jgi:hypothetical protein